MPFYIRGFGTGSAEAGPCMVWNWSDLKGKISVIRSQGSAQRLLNREWVNSLAGEERAWSGLLMHRLSSPLTGLTAEGALNSSLTPCHFHTEHYFHFVFSFPSRCSTPDASAALPDLKTIIPLTWKNCGFGRSLKSGSTRSIQIDSLCAPTYKLFWNKMMQSRTTWQPITLWFAQWKRELMHAAVTNSKLHLTHVI